MKNGCILCGGVGSGKSRTSLAYYYQEQGGDLDADDYVPMDDPSDLYIITTARKRDTQEWALELAPFLMTVNEENQMYHHKVVIDSWNNIQKYDKVYNAFFIFDEQRVVGSGAWVKAFLKIARNNRWILLSATPGDCWMDYLPVFLANGFYRNKTEFIQQHVIYSRHVTKFPKIDRYVGTKHLEMLRNDILVTMDFHRETKAHHEDVPVFYDRIFYKEVGRDRWDHFGNKPLRNAAELCYQWRRIVNSDVSRRMAVSDICREHPRVIIFYNFDYELDFLLNPSLYADGTEVAQWNGHRHDKIPDTGRWVYLVQYTAGCEGWNCITTDTMIFYSQNYSYKVMAQAAGRTDRLNTPYSDLWYYHLKSSAPIDRAIAEALSKKKNFNEGKFVSW